MVYLSMKGKKMTRSKSTILLIFVSLLATSGVARARDDGMRGLAAEYPGDKGIVEDSAVLAFSGFEGDGWRKVFSGGRRGTVSVVGEDTARKFEPLQGKALRIKVEKGGHYGASIQYQFKKRLGSEPEEIYFRYYLRLGDDWDPERGGKLPGIGGTYGRAGWGGRPSDGRNGWSARGQFNGRKEGKTPIGYYCYHADMRGRYGSGWIWEKDKLGYLENNRWYCIEQYAKMNTPGKNDGILRGWVDGRLAFEKKDVRMRDVAELKIETIWINIYHGGTWPSPSEDHLYIDNVVIAKKYIGPMHKDGDGRMLPQDPNGNFTLYVSNQSFDENPVDITIHIDGKKAVERDFDVKGKRTAQHNWIKHRFSLSPGKHRITAKSKKGKASLEKEFEIEDKHWAVIDYWWYPTIRGGSGPTARKFTFMIQNSPIGFE